MFPTHPTPNPTPVRQHETVAALGIRHIRQLNAHTYMCAHAHTRTPTQNHVSDVSDVSDINTKY